MPIKIFLAVTTKSGKEKEVQMRLRAIDGVTLSCSITEGHYNVVAMVEVPSLDEYRSFSVDRVSLVPNIDDYTSFIIMEE
jgi:DNA-binding Lrp family transcriptional regulator